MEDQDFAHDLPLLSHSHRQIEGKTELLNTVSTKTTKANTKNNNPITLKFTYLGSTINKNGGTEEDVKARIQKARVAFIMLRKIWRAKQIKSNTKLRLFNLNVRAVLIYGLEKCELYRIH